MSVLLWFAWALALALPIPMPMPQGLRRLELSDFDAGMRQELAQEPALREVTGGAEDAPARFARFITEMATQDAARAVGGLDYDLPALVAFTCADPREPEMGPFHRRYSLALALALGARDVEDAARLLDQDPDGLRGALVQSVLKARGVPLAMNDQAAAALQVASDEIDRFIAEEGEKLSAGTEAHDEHFTDWSLKTTTLTALPMKIGLLTDRIVRRLKNVPRGAAAPVKRALVVGPGVDIANRHLGPFGRVAIYQPFELEASLLRHGLADPSALTIDCLDINPLIVRHLQGAIARARSGQSYPLTVFHFLRGPFAFADVRGYVEEFLAGLPDVKRRPGPERISIESFAQAYERARADGAATPANIAELRARAAIATVEVQIPPPGVLRLNPVQGDLVTEALPAASYDVILCTNLLVYFEPGPRALAVANMARALKPGGVLIATDRLVPKPGGVVLGLKHIHSELYERFDPQYVYQR
jgi:SAM-dependent methyltransferase